MSSFSHKIVHLTDQAKRGKVCWLLIGSKSNTRLLCKSQSNPFLLVKEMGTRLKTPRAAVGRLASKQVGGETLPGRKYTRASNRVSFEQI